MTIDFPEKLKPLFNSKRYKVLYGGRLGLKSWSVARALLIMAAQQPLRVLCARELQKSIRDSVHKLLTDQIQILNLSTFYEITQISIQGKNGSEFFFEGLRHNAAQIKSYEGVDRVWVEEAQSVSKSSWDYLIPTIRKEGSEIWISFNPELDTDETYKRFVIDPPSNAIVIKTSYRDNLWLTEDMQIEMSDLRRKDEDAYQNIYEGRCKSVVEGAIYANEIRFLEADNRLVNVPYDKTKPVHTFWDLGWADNTSIWFVQQVGLEFRIIDCYQNSRQAIQHYVQVLQQRGYVYGTDYLPHDARAKQLGTGKSIEEMLQGLGRRVEVVPMLSVLDGINAVRAVISQCWFDKVKCADGLQSLRRYKYDITAEGRESRLPLHDEYSHYSDAFRYFAVTPHVQWDVIVETQEYGREGKLLSDYDPLSEERLSGVLS